MDRLWMCTSLDGLGGCCCSDSLGFGMVVEAMAGCEGSLLGCSAIVYVVVDAIKVN